MLSKIASNFWTVLFTVGLWYLSLWENPLTPPDPFADGEHLPKLFAEVLFPHKISIGIAFSIFVIVAHLLAVYFSNRHNQRRFFCGLLDQIISHKLHGNVASNRITIFGKKRGICFIHRYLWMCFGQNFRAHKKKNLLLYCIKECPRPFRNYLVNVGRKGMPYEDGTSTFFKIPKHMKDTNGIVSYVAATAMPYSVTLPDLRTIDLDQFLKVENVPAETKRDVEQYIKKGRIKDFNRLKSIHRHSMHIWATPVFDKAQNFWGVVAIDSNDTANPFTARSFESDLVSYCKLLEKTIHEFAI